MRSGALFAGSHAPRAGSERRGHFGDPLDDRLFPLPRRGKVRPVQIRKLIERRIRRAGGGVNVDSDVHAVVAANVGERGAVTHASSEQTASAGSKTARAERDDPA
jgi:hypothetical protein